MNDVTCVGQSTSYKKERCAKSFGFESRHITKLSIIFKSLKRLRYLNLSGNSFKNTLEWIDKLFYSRILKLNNCIELEYLPQSFRNIRNLRHLQFWKCEKIPHMPSEFAE